MRSCEEPWMLWSSEAKRRFYAVTGMEMVCAFSEDASHIDKDASPVLPDSSLFRATASLQKLYAHGHPLFRCVCHTEDEIHLWLATRSLRTAPSPSRNGMTVDLSFPVHRATNPLGIELHYFHARRHCCISSIAIHSGDDTSVEVSCIRTRERNGTTFTGHRFDETWYVTIVKLAPVQDRQLQQRARRVCGHMGTFICRHPRRSSGGAPMPRAVCESLNPKMHLVRGRCFAESKDRMHIALVWEAVTELGRLESRNVILYLTIFNT